MVDERFSEVPMKRTERISRRRTKKERDRFGGSQRRRMTAEDQPQPYSDKPFDPLGVGKGKFIKFAEAEKSGQKDHEGEHERRPQDDQEDDRRDDEKLPSISSFFSIFPCRSR